MSEPSPRAPIATAPVSVILFAHSFAADAAEAMAAWQRYLESLNRPYEIFQIQETRSDVAPADAPAESPPQIRTFTYDRAAGFREAVHQAIASAQHPLLTFCTCDRQYQPADLERLLKVIDHVDLVAGYRIAGPAPPWRLLLDTIQLVVCRVVLGIPLEVRRTWLGNAGWRRRWVARWLFGVRVLDPECPFRLARREVFARWPIQSGGPFVHVEMLAKANHLTCLMAEEGVSWTPPPVSLEGAITFGQDAWAIFRAPDFGRYEPPATETPPILQTPSS